MRFKRGFKGTTWSVAEAQSAAATAETPAATLERCGLLGVAVNQARKSRDLGRKGKKVSPFHSIAASVPLIIGNKKVTFWYGERTYMDLDNLSFWVAVGNVSLQHYDQNVEVGFGHFD